MPQRSRRLLRELEKHLSLLGQPDAGPVPLHQARAQYVLELAQRLGDGRLGQVQFGSGLLEASGAGDRTEGIEVAELDATIHFIP